ncbi:hypothetical protein [Marinicella sp. W31]|uniref:hypothetical protein n=1 Tax=Marinicella sp. W31 TaxID=3023713 RepID=UPI00375677B8
MKMMIQKKVLTLLLALCAFYGCSRMVKEEPYLTSEQSSGVSVPEGKDSPNTSNALEIPPIPEENQSGTEPDIRPPAISFVSRRSRDERVNIVERNDLPVLEIVGTDDDMWALMQKVSLTNWEVRNADQDSCKQVLYFTDLEFQKVEDRGFFKRIFSAAAKYEDQSGLYSIQCAQANNRNTIVMQGLDGQPLHAQAVDQLMGELFNLIATDQ